MSCLMTSCRCRSQLCYFHLLLLYLEHTAFLYVHSPHCELLHVLCACTLTCFHRTSLSDPAYQLTRLIWMLTKFLLKTTNKLPVYFRCRRLLFHACKIVFWFLSADAVSLNCAYLFTLVAVSLMSFCGHFCCIAETECQGTDHLDLAGLPQRSQNSDSTHTLPTSPDGKKKSKGIKKIFGKWVKNTIDTCAFRLHPVNYNQYK